MSVYFFASVKSMGWIGDWFLSYLRTLFQPWWMVMHLEGDTCSFGLYEGIMVFSWRYWGKPRRISG